MHSSFIENSVYTVLWFCLFWIPLTEIITRILPVPSAIAKIEDKKEQKKQFYRYVSDMFALLHSPIVTTAAFYLLYKNGYQFNSANTSDELRIIRYSTGFFMADTMYGILRRYNDKLVHFHHAVMILGSFYCYYLNKHSNTVL
jgi:hypothetical protein